MKYKNIKVLEINPVVYLGEEFKNNDWRDNQKLFKERIKDLDFNVSFEIECPLEDLIYVQVDYEDDFEPLIKMNTIDKIFRVTNELLKVFENNVKVNLYLDSYMKNGDISVDMTITEFVRWLYEEVEKCDDTGFILENEHEVIKESEQDKLNKEIERLYLKIKDGTMEQNSTELFTYMWLSELRDRRLEDENISYYRANVYLNKNEMVHFESSSKEKLIESMKNTLSSSRFKDDFVSKIMIYALKEIDTLLYEELLNR